MKKAFLFITALAMSAMMMAAEKTLTFDLTSNPGGWPTSNSTTPTDYTYTLDDVDYTFVLKNVKCNSGYLMFTQPASLGLPAIEGYKLTKVVAKNTSGCSTSVNVGVSSSATEANYISGGEAQTWATQSSSYTYELNETSDNVVYYLYVTKKNAQITELELTYTSGVTPQRTLQSIYIDGEATELEYFVGESFDPAGLKVMGVYDSGEDTEITAGIEWTIVPGTLALGTTSVNVTAQYKDFTSEVFTVNNIVVTEKPAPVGATYTKVTAAPDNWAGEYVVVYEVEETARVFTGVDAASNFVEAEIIDNTVVGDFNTVILEATEGGYLVKVNGGDNDGKYISSAGDANELKFNETGAVMTVSYDTESASTLIANPAGAVLRYNKASNQDRFRLYKAATYTNQQPIQLYKKTAVGPTGIREAMINANVRKAMVNGRLIIVKGEKAFDLQGRIVK